MKIAVITGGETAERDVSIRSANNVLEAINFADKEIFTFPEDYEWFKSVVGNFDLAIPVIHGVGGEDGSLQRYLKSIGLPFIFSDTDAHEVAIDKRSTKEVAKPLGVNTPKDIEGFPMFVKPITGGSSVASKLCASKKEVEEIFNANPKTDFLKEENLPLEF